MMSYIWHGNDPALRVGSTLGGPTHRRAYTNFGNAQTLSALSSATVALTVSDVTLHASGSVQTP